MKEGREGEQDSSAEQEGGEEEGGGKIWWVQQGIQTWHPGRARENAVQY